MTMAFNREGGVCSYYQSGKRNSVAELRLHSPREIMTSLTEVKGENSFHYCLRYARSEEMKERRRLVGDNGGIKFQGKIAMVRDDRCVNTITNVLKDNLILENYERIQRD